MNSNITIFSRKKKQTAEVKMIGFRTLQNYEHNNSIKKKKEIYQALKTSRITDPGKNTLQYGKKHSALEILLYDFNRINTQNECLHIWRKAILISFLKRDPTSVELSVYNSPPPHH